MVGNHSRTPSILLEPPAKGVEVEDTGAAEPVSDSGDEHFSDAIEGQGSPAHQASRPQTPVPRTRVEKVDCSPRYGEMPGSPAYEKRTTDAVPDEIEIIENKQGLNQSTTSLDRPVTPGGTPVPLTVVEKVDPHIADYGEEPGTDAYESRVADAAPDQVFKIDDARIRTPQQHSDDDDGNPDSRPETLLSRVESLPKEHSSRRLSAHGRRPSDALPDAEEVVSEIPGSQMAAPSRSENENHDQQNSSLSIEDSAEDAVTPNEAENGEKHDNNNDDGDDMQFGDDFDDFKDCGGGSDQDDFGDFDDGFEEPMPDYTPEPIAEEQEAATPTQPDLPQSPLPPLLDFSSLKSFTDILAATTDQLDTLFPNSTDLSSLPPVEPFSDSSAIFTTERSLSLWSQLVAPPPLQPPNWTKSRIRRLFLVSIGVPVDLDEILPASKQKKLVLPSINLEGTSSAAPATTGSSASGTTRSRSTRRKRLDGQSRSSTSLDSARSSSRQRNFRRRGYPPPPELDLSAARRLCATTDAALDGLTDEEMQEHISKLEQMTTRASEVLEYWLKKRDNQLGEKEAFEGVIENLVKHARQVRK